MTFLPKGICRSKALPTRPQWSLRTNKLLLKFIWKWPKQSQNTKDERVCSLALKASHEGTVTGTVQGHPVAQGRAGLETDLPARMPESRQREGQSSQEMGHWTLNQQQWPLPHTLHQRVRQLSDRLATHAGIPTASSDSQTYSQTSGKSHTYDHCLIIKGMKQEQWKESQGEGWAGPELRAPVRLKPESRCSGWPNISWQVLTAKKSITC